jgi:hypothetical protein
MGDVRMLAHSISVAHNAPKMRGRHHPKSLISGARRCRGAGLSSTEPRVPPLASLARLGPPGVHPWREKDAVVH